MESQPKILNSDSNPGNIHPCQYNYYDQFRILSPKFLNSDVIMKTAIQVINTLNDLPKILDLLGPEMIVERRQKHTFINNLLTIKENSSSRENDVIERWHVQR